MEKAPPMTPPPAHPKDSGDARVNSESRRDGRALDYVGYYNPMTKPADIKIDQEKIRIWMERGAHPSDTVRSLLKQAGFAG